MAIPGAILGAPSGDAHVMCTMRPIAALLLLVSMMFPSAGSIANAEETPMKPSVSYRTVKVDGLSIFYREAGRKDAPTLVLLHGLPSSSRMFEPLFSRLSDRYHLIAPDYPGLDTATGRIRRSSRIPSITWPLSSSISLRCSEFPNTPCTCRTTAVQ